MGQDFNMEYTLKTHSCFVIQFHYVLLVRSDERIVVKMAINLPVDLHMKGKQEKETEPEVYNIHTIIVSHFHFSTIQFRILTS